jgi:Tfp pilus assembly PilM family ATPase
MKTAQNKCREEDVVGLDINSGRLTAAHFARTEQGMKLDRLVTGDYPPELSDRQIASRIRAFWKKEKLPGRIVRTCLHSRALLVRYFQYSNLNTEELGMALSLEAEETLQRPAPELCIDWHLNSSAESDLSKLTGTLVAAPRKTVRRHLDLIQAAGLYSVNVETSCSALCNCYSFFFGKKETSPVCLVNLADRTADIIMRTESCIYPRTLFSADEPWETNSDYLLENIQNALLYYHLKIKQGPVERVVLIGKIPAPQHFPGKLERKVSLPVEVLDVCSHPDIGIEKQKLPTSGNCNIATAIGLALREFGDEPV